MNEEAEVRAAAERRATALSGGDAQSLSALLHPDFQWTSHTGEHFDHATYLQANIDGQTRWHRQQLEDVVVKVVARTAIHRCTVLDDVTNAMGRAIYRMPVTQTWVNTDVGWQCLAGHAGPRIPS